MIVRLHFPIKKLAARNGLAICLAVSIVLLSGCRLGERCPVCHGVAHTLNAPPATAQLQPSQPSTVADASPPFSVEEAWQSIESRYPQSTPAFQSGWQAGYSWARAHRLGVQLGKSDPMPLPTHANTDASWILGRRAGINDYVQLQMVPGATPKGEFVVNPPARITEPPATHAPRQLPQATAKPSKSKPLQTEIAADQHEPLRSRLIDLPPPPSIADTDQSANVDSKVDFMESSQLEDDITKTLDDDADSETITKNNQNTDLPLETTTPSNGTADRSVRAESTPPETDSVSEADLGAGRTLDTTELSVDWETVDGTTDSIESIEEADSSSAATAARDATSFDEVSQSEDSVPPPVSDQQSTTANIQTRQVEQSVLVNPSELGTDSQPVPRLIARPISGLIHSEHAGEPNQMELEPSRARFVDEPLHVPPSAYEPLPAVEPINPKELQRGLELENDQPLKLNAEPEPEDQLEEQLDATRQATSNDVIKSR